MCKKVMGLLSFVFVSLFASFFISSSFLSSDSYALDDLSYTYTSGSTLSFYQHLIPNCNSACFRQYSYLVYDSSEVSQTSLTVTLYNSPSNISYLTLNSYSNVLTLHNSYDIVFQGNSFTFSSDTTFTLTNHIGDCPDCPDCPDEPSGSLDITENGTYDVSSYSSAVVNVPSEVVQGDYHDDLVSIKVSILICGAVIIVLYFFYCIYRLIIKNSGVK